MSRAGWLQDPWSKVSEIVHELTPAELVKLLMAVWDTLIKFPPQAEHSPSTLRNEFGRLKPLFVENIVALAPYYARFFPLSKERPESPDAESMHD